MDNERSYDEIMKDVEEILGDNKFLTVPSNTKYVITIAEDKENEAYILDLLNVTDDLTLEETYEALKDIFDDLTTIVDTLEWHIEEKNRTKDKAERKANLKVFKNSDKND